MATNFGMYFKCKDCIHESKWLIERLNQGVERFCQKLMKFCFKKNLTKKQSFFSPKDKNREVLLRYKGLTKNI
jgi:hypothetical protein